MPGDHLAIGAANKRASIEDEFILATHQVKVNDRNTGCFCALAHHLLLTLTSLMQVIGRGVQIHNYVRARRRTVCDGLGVPDILTNGQSQIDTAYLKNARLIACREIPLFIKDPKIRQFPLEISGRDPPL